jgi:hypothetical protein
MYLGKIELPAGGKLIVGHVDEAGLDDQDVPLLSQEYTEGDQLADAYCTSCPARSTISYSDSGMEVLVIVVHQDGCPELAVFRAQLGTKGEG